MAAAKVKRWQLGALWMRAVANSCGYGPGTAKPLALAYATARRHPKAYQREVEEHLAFAGLWFIEPDDGEICTNGESFCADDYDERVVEGFASHHPLFYRAVDVAELLPFGKADSTSMAWDRFTAGMGGRSSLSVASAHKLLDGILS